MRFRDWYLTLGISRKTAYRYRAKGWIATHLIGGISHVTDASLAQFKRMAEEGKLGMPHICGAELRRGRSGRQP